MSGLYLHIPFCKQRCIYCDFYSTAAKEVSNAYISSLIAELRYRKSFLSDKVSTLYFGGGTPSSLTPTQVNKILTEINNIFPLSQMEEITFEANPDDLQMDYLKGLKELGITRLSIGIQSFNDHYLRLLKRRHTALQAHNAVCDAHNAGFENISIDLMFALPNMTTTEWEKTLAQAIMLPVKHLSAYILTRETGTMLDKIIAKGLLKMPDEALAVEQFDFTDNYLSNHNFIHYETSSYCLNGWHSKHNSNYWKRVPYLGIGASAHSYNGRVRQWNVSNVRDYISLPPDAVSQQEILNLQQQYEEYIMLSLRTIEGIDLSMLQNEFSPFYNQFLTKLNAQINKGYLKRIDNNVITTLEGQHLLNEVLVSLF
ncbi:MAG: radical SAM family heme chaperone HemW [Bacteroidales bacterium]|jgi:oxygen-independent coproporphyrinogen-3 oxidase|nr:radical SAM family heme chaperone HemW [Bacteroidales bacterium]